MIDTNTAHLSVETPEEIPAADRLDSESRALSSYLDRIGRVKLPSITPITAVHSPWPNLTGCVSMRVSGA